MLTFEEGLQVDVTKHIEKKGRFSYLSWVYAEMVFKKHFPDGDISFYDFDQFNDDGKNVGMINYMITPAGCFVRVRLRKSQDSPWKVFDHPVLNHSNKTIANPNAFEINTSRQRALAKIFSKETGIGLHIYAGEDLPPSGPAAAEPSDEPMDPGEFKSKALVAIEAASVASAVDKIVKHKDVVAAAKSGGWGTELAETAARALARIERQEKHDVT